MNCAPMHTPWVASHDGTLAEVSDARGQLLVIFRGAGPLQHYMADLIAAAPSLLSNLDASIEREYNPFEPDNQSARYTRMVELRARVPDLKP
jgi:hypothetical protein